MIKTTKFELPGICVILIASLKGPLIGLVIVCWTTYHYHRRSNLGVGISVGCFIVDFASLPLQVARPIYPTMFTNVAVKTSIMIMMIASSKVTSLVAFNIYSFMAL